MPVVALLLLAPPFVLLAYFGASEVPRNGITSGVSAMQLFAGASALFGGAALASAIVGAWDLATLGITLWLMYTSFAISRRTVGHR